MKIVAVGRLNAEQIASVIEQVENKEENNAN
jgi:hypothetical protein